MNKFESNNPENSHEGGEEYEEYKDLIEYEENLETQERLKEKVEHGPHVVELEEMLTSLLKEVDLDVLSAIETEEEAINSKEREFTKEALIPILDKIVFLDRRTNISKEELEGLREKYKIIANASGYIHKGIVYHDR